MSKDPKDWQGWALAGACALVFAFGGILWANAASRISITESRVQAVEVDQATVKALLTSMKETVERIERKVDKR